MLRSGAKDHVHDESDSTIGLGVAGPEVPLSYQKFSISQHVGAPDSHILIHLPPTLFLSGDDCCTPSSYSGQSLLPSLVGNTMTIGRHNAKD